MVTSMRKTIAIALIAAFSLAGCSTSQVESAINGAKEKVTTEAAKTAASSLAKLLADEAAKRGLPIDDPRVLEAVQSAFVGAEIATASGGRLQVTTLGAQACLTLVPTTAVLAGACVPEVDEGAPSR